MRLGFVRLVDAAPILVASAFGFFSRRGLKVELVRLVGWATVREKLVYGELDLAQALCSMPFAATLGLDSIPSPCVTGLVLNRGGNAIVLSANLWDRGVRDSKTLRQDIANSRHFRKYILATVHDCSTHAYLLRQWLRSAGIDPDRDVQLVSLPPAQMCRNLSVGTIDGFCAGEPWPSMAISEGIGWSPAASVDIMPRHPEKVLMARSKFDQARREEHLEVIAALLEACMFCEDSANRPEVSRLLAERRHLNCDASLVEKCMSSEFGYGKAIIGAKRASHCFYGNGINRPGMEEANWVVAMIREFYPGLDRSELEAVKAKVFRADLFDQARKLANIPEAALV